MEILSGYLDNVYMAWLNSSVNCCSPLKDQAPRRGVEKSMRLEYHQPRLVPPPIPEPQERPSTRGREWVTRTRSFASRASSRGSFAVRRKLNAYNGPRRPRISSPREFRHIEDNASRQAERFRPLELSIYMPENTLSPLLPHFGAIDDLSMPQRNSREFPFPPAHVRSESALSFRIPRKPLRSSSSMSYEANAQFKYRPESLNHQEELAALANPISQLPPPVRSNLRMRSMTEPPSYERVKSALHEKYELEQRLRDIEEIIEERKSIYNNSRPTSRVTSRPASMYSEAQEPMPPPPLITSLSVPIPPVAPNFASRISTPSPVQRPKTAPSKTVHIPARLKSFSEASATFTTPSPSSATSSRGHSHADHSLPPPPLPLVLQAPHPPLRKKKSFSRVSSWLFPPSSGNDSTPTIPLESVTNKPKPVTNREGFYQCLDIRPSEALSTASLSTVSTLSESELDEPTVPTTWTRTPDSSPGGSKARDIATRDMSLDLTRDEKSLELARMRTFGDKDQNPDENWRLETLPAFEHRHGRNSVGVAF